MRKPLLNMQGYRRNHQILKSDNISFLKCGCGEESRLWSVAFYDFFLAKTGYIHYIKTNSVSHCTGILISCSSSFPVFVTESVRFGEYTVQSSLMRLMLVVLIYFSSSGCDLFVIVCFKLIKKNTSFCFSINSILFYSLSYVIIAKSLHMP